jgi:hypothetical protein
MWIKCSDKLPPKIRDGNDWSEDVLIFCGNYMSVGKYLYNTNGSSWWDLSGSDPNVTHWMPLPTPPKSDNSEAVEQSLTQGKTPAAPTPGGEICPECNGTGFDEIFNDELAEICHKCNGTGKLLLP